RVGRVVRGVAGQREYLTGLHVEDLGRGERRVDRPRPLGKRLLDDVLQVAVYRQRQRHAGLGRRLAQVPARDLGRQVALADLELALPVPPVQQVVAARLQAGEPVQVVAYEAQYVGGQVVAGHLAALVPLDPDALDVQRAYRIAGLDVHPASEPLELLR